jgi:biotin synthase
MTLGFLRGRFYRDAKLGCINLLMEYDEGCQANCLYCGQAREVADSAACRSLIRVQWPSYALERVVSAIREKVARNSFIERVCVASIHHPKAPEDMLKIVGVIRGALSLYISTLITPTVFKRRHLIGLASLGVDNITVAVDLATPELFQKVRGSGAFGPHRWERYLECLEEAREVMGTEGGGVGAHLIVGLGETEEEAIRFIQWNAARDIRTHLFSFYPEAGSALADHQQPPMEHYRRVQLAKHLIDHDISQLSRMSFRKGVLVDPGVAAEEVEKTVSAGIPFMTTGCSGCNRPFANETPAQAMAGLLRNFPFPPKEEDIRLIQEQVIFPTLPGRACGGCQ